MVRDAAVARLRIWFIGAMIVSCVRPIRVEPLTWTPPVAPSDTTAYARFLRAQLDSVRAANPTADAEAALARGDYRLVGIQGYSLQVPGLNPRDWERYGSTYGFRVVAGTDEITRSNDQWALQGAAYRYAQAYNRLVLQRLPDSGRWRAAP